MKIKYYKYLFGLIFLFEPLIVGSLVNSSFRMISIILLLTYLIVKIAVKKNKIKINTSLITYTLILVVTLGAAVNYDNQKSFISLTGFLCIISIAILFSIYSKKNTIEVNFLIKQYRIFFEITSILTIISIIFVYLFGNIDIYGLSWDGYSTEGYVYISTPFGLTLPKYFGEVELQRGMFFFVEPAYLGFFLGFNLIFIYTKSKHFSTRFLYLNFIAGILTLSLTFILILIFILALKFVKLNQIKPKSIIIYPVLFIIFYLLISKSLEFSSLIDRLGLLNQFFDHFLNSTNQNKIFGMGITKNEFNLNLSFSSGLLQAISEFGIIGLILIILLFCGLTNYNFIMIGIFIIGLVTFEVHKTLLFWYATVLLGICTNSNTKNSFSAETKLRTIPD